MTTPPAPRLISLFAGVGGFDLGFEAAGFRTVGQCEIDPHALQVLTRHWPDVPKHPDVTTLTPDHFEPAEVITFGSPCQDLSVAGKRAGLAGERSGLFTAAIDYIRAMQEATNGQYPKLVIWENVPGAFSSNGGHDFAAVLSSMVGGSTRPTPPEGGWPTAGVAFGPEGAAEWRVLDSQYFGVAQRRRRVFVIYHPRGERAGQILLEPQGVPGHPKKGRAPGEGITGALTGGAGSSSAGNPDGNRAQAGFLVPVENDTAPTVLASWGHNGYSSPRGDGTDPIVPVAFKVRGGVEVDSAGKTAGKGYLGSEDKALTLGASQDQYLAEPQAPAARGYVTYPIDDGRPMEKRQNGLGIGGPSDPSYTLDTTGAQSVAFTASNYATGSYKAAEKAEAITTSEDRTRAAPLTLAPYAVRRLTPRECERLQAFPDDWTRYAVDGSEIADTHRYRMCGNAVTASVAEWIARRALTELQHAPTKEQPA